MRLLPEEWTASWSALRAMGGLTAGAGFSARHLIAFAVPLSVGAWVGWHVAPAFMSAQRENTLFALLAGVIALGSLLAGFMVTLMLFTGRIEQASALTLEELQAYARRIKFLLSSQAQTLFAAVLSAVFAIVWLCFFALSLDVAAQRIVGAVCFGFTAVALLRCILVPLQIYEIHEATLDDAVADRIKQEQEKYRRD
ncbi:hypothetical protein [Lysobacter changpingensis]|uniref:hypothetical protein n=1 Tax=Lysobacter changpingensis TaxID=2792784 RepID=UPI001A8C352E|nr:hypothetical protein [Lysobacter changpingensis]